MVLEPTHRPRHPGKPSTPPAGTAEPAQRDVDAWPSAWRLDPAGPGTTPYGSASTWLRSLAVPVRFLLLADPCTESDVRPLGEGTDLAQLPHDLRALAAGLASHGLVQRHLYLVPEKDGGTGRAASVPDPVLLGLQPSPLAHGQRAALVARLTGGPGGFVLPEAGEVHLADRMLGPLPRTNRFGRVPGGSKPSTPALRRGTRTWRDLAAPTHVRVGHDRLQVDGRFVTLITVDGLPRELSSDSLAPLWSLPFGLDLCLRVVPLDTDLVVRYLTRRLRDLRSSRLAAQHTDAFRIDDAVSDAVALREALYVGATRLWQLALTIAVWGHTSDEIQHHTHVCLERLRQGGFLGRIAVFRQWEALWARVPGHPDTLDVVHNVASEAVLHLLPLDRVTPPATGVLLGRHAHDHSPMHLARRAPDVNPAMLVVGRPGSGKSALAKMELRRALLSSPLDRALIVDPEDEYGDVAKALGGLALRADRDTPFRVSPFLAASEAPGLTADLMATALGAQSPEDVAAVRGALRRLLETTGASTRDPHNLGLEAFLPYLAAARKDLADRLRDLMDGPLRPFVMDSAPIEVPRVVALGLTGVEPALLPAILPFATHVLLEHVRPPTGGLSWLTVDEFHLFLGHAAGTRLLVQLAKRARKRGIVFTAVTQHVEDLLTHPEGRILLAAMGTVVLFDPGIDVRPFAETLALSERDLAWLPRLRTGRALLCTSTRRAPVDVTLSNLEQDLVETRPLAVRGAAPGTRGGARIG